MNRFDNESKKNRIFGSITVSVVIFGLIIGAFINGVSFLSKESQYDEKEALINALDRDVAHAYAVEGAYPKSIEDIEEKYGLTYDHDKFIVDYKSIGANIYPAITVIERSDG